MHAIWSFVIAAAAVALSGNIPSAVAQQPSPGSGTGMGGMGPGLARGFTDPATHLDELKADLEITPAQEPAWKDYADTVEGVATQMQGAHQTMDAMGTATWEERRDMMNRMCATACEMVQAAAQKLLPSLTPTQRTRATTSLPGLRVGGPGMMRRMGSPPGTGNS